MKYNTSSTVTRSRPLVVPRVAHTGRAQIKTSEGSVRTRWLALIGGGSEIGK